MLKNKVDAARLGHNSPYQPLGLDPWTEAFDIEGNLLAIDSLSNYDDDYSNQLSPDRYSSYQLAMEVAEANADELADSELRNVAIAGLMTSLTDQASRNSKANSSQLLESLTKQYGQSDANALIFGKARADRLAQTVLDNDDKLVSLEIARYSHVNQWQLVDDVNQDVRQLLSQTANLQAEDLGDRARYKIKGFYERAVLIERKRHVMKLLGGKAIVVMRLNFLIDKQSQSLPLRLQHHIGQEEDKLLDRSLPRYDFNAENDLLYELLESSYISPNSHDEVEQPEFIVPLQTGYYTYSPEALSREKQDERHESRRQEFTAITTKNRWASDW